MIRLEHVSKSYGDRAIVRDLSLEAPSGQVTVLLGPSGCGKTTTLKMINGLIPLTSGRIRVGDQDLATADPIQLRRRIGYVIQDIGLFPHYTVADNVALVPRLLGWDEGRVRRRVLELLELVNLPEDRLRAYPHQLSGGQQQRVGVARALAGDPEFLLMDEPFGAIDPINRAHIQDEFRRIQAHLRKTVVMVTHDLDEALKLGDRIAILDAGELAQVDTPEALLRRPASPFVARFLGEDRALRLLRRHRVGESMRTAFPHLVLGHSPPALEDLRAALARHPAPMALVADDSGRYVGCLLAADVAPGRVLAPRTEPAPVHPDEPLAEALARLVLSGAGALPVVADGQPVGLLVAEDLVRASREPSGTGDLPLEVQAG